MSYRERITAPGPKRLLALDGGGIRGIISLSVLAELERGLRRQSGRSDLVLADAFDYIGGNSTGAVIAAGLALGFEVDRLLDLYCDRGEEMFDRARIRDRFRNLYDDQTLARLLQDEMGPDTTFGSDRLRTLLMLVLRNATTDSPWPVSNNPAARFNHPDLPGSNLALPLWQLVRASTAAPLYFPPEKVVLGAEEFVFVDGAITPYNNPALQLFVMATAPAYHLEWPTGEDELLVVSVGTGGGADPRPGLDPADLHMVQQVVSSMKALLSSAATQQDVLCRLLGRCRFGPVVDAELGDLVGANQGLAREPLFSYVRYDIPLDRTALDSLGFDGVPLHHVLPIDSVEHIDTLRAVGRAVADRIVDIEHLDGFFP